MNNTNLSHNPYLHFDNYTSSSRRNNNNNMTTPRFFTFNQDYADLNENEDEMSKVSSEAERPEKTKRIPTPIHNPLVLHNPTNPNPLNPVNPIGPNRFAYKNHSRSFSSIYTDTIKEVEEEKEDEREIIYNTPVLTHQAQSHHNHNNNNGNNAINKFRARAQSVTLPIEKKKAPFIFSPPLNPKTSTCILSPSLLSPIHESSDSFHEKEHFSFNHVSINLSLSSPCSNINNKYHNGDNNVENTPMNKTIPSIISHEFDETDIDTETTENTPIHGTIFHNDKYSCSFVNPNQHHSNTPHSHSSSFNRTPGNMFDSQVNDSENVARELFSPKFKSLSTRSKRKPLQIKTPEPSHLISQVILDNEEEEEDVENTDQELKMEEENDFQEINKNLLLRRKSLVYDHHTISDIFYETKTKTNSSDNTTKALLLDLPKLLPSFNFSFLDEARAKERLSGKDYSCQSVSLCGLVAPPNSPNEARVPSPRIDNQTSGLFNLSKLNKNFSLWPLPYSFIAPSILENESQ